MYFQHVATLSLQNWFSIPHFLKIVMLVKALMAQNYINASKQRLGVSQIMQSLK